MYIFIRPLFGRIITYVQDKEFGTIYDVIVTVTHGPTHTGSLRRFMEIWGGDFTLNSTSAFILGLVKEGKRRKFPTFIPQGFT